MATMTAHCETTGSVRPGGRTGKYLTLQLGSEEFGIRVLQVKEIMGMQGITAVPQTPSHVKGVINLRGKVVPVLCLRTRFGLAPAEYTARTCIIVVQVQGDAGPVQVGVIVDTVSEVLTVASGEIEDTPDFGAGAPTPYLLGMAKIRGKVKILLDIDRVVNTQDVIDLQAVAA